MILVTDDIYANTGYEFYWYTSVAPETTSQLDSTTQQESTTHQESTTPQHINCYDNTQTECDIPICDRYPHSPSYEGQEYEFCDNGNSIADLAQNSEAEATYADQSLEIFVDRNEFNMNDRIVNGHPVDYILQIEFVILGKFNQI